MPPPVLPLLFTPLEAASRLKVSRGTVYREIAKGLLSCSRVGAQVRLSEADLVAYLDRSRQGPLERRSELRRRPRRR